jgi:hypothetical protein
MEVKDNKNALAYYSKAQDSAKIPLQHFLESCVQQNQLFFPRPGISYRRGRLSTVDLLDKIACFVKKDKYIFSRESS